MTETREQPEIVPSAEERAKIAQQEAMRFGWERILPDYFTVTYRDGWNATMRAMSDELRTTRAEIERLTAALQHDHGHNEPCVICGEPCNCLHGNPSLWAVRLDNKGWRHIGCVNAKLREARSSPAHTKARGERDDG